MRIVRLLSILSIITLKVFSAHVDDLIGVLRKVGTCSFTCSSLSWWPLLSVHCIHVNLTPCCTHFFQTYELPILEVSIVLWQYNQSIYRVHQIP